MDPIQPPKDLDDVHLELEILRLGVDANHREHLRYTSYMRPYILEIEALRKRVALLESICWVALGLGVAFLHERVDTASSATLMVGYLAASLYFWWKGVRERMRRRKAALAEHEAANAFMIESSVDRRQPDHADA